MKARYAVTAAAVLAICLPAAAQERQKDEGVALTVYNGGYAVVRETRELNIPDSGRVKFTDVASGIDPTTVHFKSLTDADATLLEQNYQYDLVSASKLLEKYVDKEIHVVTEAGGYSGTLLSHDGGHLVMDTDDGGIAMIRRADNVRDIRFGALPEGLLTRPTLVWLVATGEPGEHLTEVTYQTNGIGWHAEYVFVLNEGDTKADLSGWVSVDNESGKTYRDAKLKFIAGDVHRERPRAAARPMELARRAPRPEPMEEKAFFEYHMYTLPRPSTVADKEVKQLEMFPPARDVGVDKKYLYQPLARFRWSQNSRNTSRSLGVESYKKVQVFVEFQNSEENNLGIPLPAGKIRVYKKDPADEAMEFVGEERIDHTPKDEKLSLEVGNAFDIVGERRQVDFRVESRRNWMRETVEIKVRNHKEEEVTVRVKEPMYRWRSWRMMESSHEYQKLDAYHVAWDLSVEPDGETVLTYTVEYTW